MRFLIALVAVAMLATACKDRGAPPASSETASAAAATCAAHAAPKELCFICDASLRDKGRLWCAEHGRYEDRCWLCHPEVKDAARPYCEEHFLYEDECFLCHPELKKTSASAAATPAAPELMCEEHGVLEAECGICHPELLAQATPGRTVKVRLPSERSASEAGVVTATPDTGRMEDGVACVAELAFDQNKLALVSPIAGGVIRSVEVDLGHKVAKGSVLARVASTGMAEAESSYLKARADASLHLKALERERALRASGMVSDKSVEEAEAAYQTASAAAQQSRQQLRLLGSGDARIDTLGATPGELEVKAPFSGEIVERTAVVGGLAETGKPLFTLADTRSLWALVSIPESQLSRVKVGQAVRVTVESLPGAVFPGRLTWLSASVDAHTRMARGRVEVANPDGRLKAQMFARALIVTDASDRAIVVPRSALQSVGGTTVVFVQREVDLFEARPVNVLAKHGESVEISGVAVGEPVAIAGTFALKSQLLLSRLGAGCVD